MIQSGWSPTQNSQIMHEVKYLLAMTVRSLMFRDDTSLADNGNSVWISFDGQLFEGEASGDAVAVAVERDGLILVGFGKAIDSGVVWFGRERLCGF